MAEKKVSDKIDLDRLAVMFKLPEWDSVLEANTDFIWENVKAAEGQAEEGTSEEELEKIRQEADSEAQDEVYHQYHGAVTKAAEEIFSAHHLELVPVRKGERYPFEYRIEPSSGKTWKDAARQLAETINGVGLTYEDPSEYNKAPRQYVLSRLGWLRSYPEVYGTPSAARIYEYSWR